LLKKDLKTKLHSPTARDNSIARQNSVNPEQANEAIDGNLQQKVTFGQKEELKCI
jgi:hypothetical protein